MQWYFRVDPIREVGHDLDLPAQSSDVPLHCSELDRLRIVLNARHLGLREAGAVSELGLSNVASYLPPPGSERHPCPARYLFL